MLAFSSSVGSWMKLIPPGVIGGCTPAGSLDVAAPVEAVPDGVAVAAPALCCGIGGAAAIIWWNCSNDIRRWSGALNGTHHGRTEPISMYPDWTTGSDS